MKWLAPVLALALAALTAGCAGGDEPAADPGAAQLGSWERVEPAGETRCARGGR